LETIHRQEESNPIIRLATAFREGRSVPKWRDPQGRLEILPKSAFWKLVRPGVQVIVGYNKTRHEVNKKVRAMLGHTGLVQPGERLICLRNNKEWNIFNGQQMTVLDVGRDRRATVVITVKTDDGRTVALPAYRQQFGKNIIEDFRSSEVALFDYGYALTAHKSQGAEWDDVLILEEVASCWDARRWRYTVATRAKKTLSYCG
jgi:exodeoxyribonuclease-5